LFSAPVDGSQPAVRLNPALSGNRDVVDFELAPDGTRVVYLADQASDELFELFSVPIDGSASPVSLGRVTPTVDRVYRIGLDSQDVFYRANRRLCRTSILGNSAPDVLDRALDAPSGVGPFQCARDGSRVFYIADQDTDYVMELYATVLGPLERRR